MGDLARVLFVGIDAGDKDLILRWARAGLLPRLRDLLERAAWGITRNPPGFFVGAVWPSFFTGLAPTRHGRYCFEQFEPGSYSSRRFRPSDLTGEPFWDALSRAGRRVAVIDIPKCAPSRDLNGIHIVDWATHDPDFEGLATWPRSLAGEVTARFGEDPLGGCNADRSTRAEFEQFRDTLRERVARKTGLSRHFLQAGGWDCFLTSFSESHCVGHQCWHLHDPTHPRHDPSFVETIGDPILDVYQAIDAGVGELLDAVGADTPVLLLASHGMGPHYDGNFLLDEVLRRLERSRGRAGLAPALRWIWRRAPRALRRRGSGLRRELRDRVNRSMACFRVPNNDVYGAIRVNVVGRESHGTIQPGAEFEAFCKELSRDLEALVNADTGERAVTRVLRTSELYPGEEVDALPDLLVEWNREAPIFALSSPQIGVVRDEPWKCRTGDHQPDGLFLFSAPWARPGRVETPVAVTDLGPTIAELLGVELPGAHGRSILPALRNA